MKDELIKAVACNGHVRILAVSGTQMVEEARRRFDMMPTASAALGRTLVAGSMMGSMLKNNEKLTIDINGGGPLGTILVNAYPDGHVRGFVSDPTVHITYNDTGKLAVGVAVGTEGTLHIIKDLDMEENWSGIVELQTGEIAEDFAYYFAVSEQTPSAVSLGVLVNEDYSIASAGGLILQMLPGAQEEDIVAVEKLMAEIKPMSTLIKDNDSLEEIVLTLFDDVKILSYQDVDYRCSCSTATMKRALLTLPKEERMAMIEEDGGAEITCNFCNEHYHFSKDDLVDLEKFVQQYEK